jgi:hypothetical protein
MKRRNLKFKLTDDVKVGDKDIKKGTMLIKGARCPMCQAFFPGAIRVSICNCGYKSEALKPWQEKRKLKEAKRLAVKV